MISRRFADENHYAAAATKAAAAIATIISRSGLGALCLITPAEARCFSVWNYPTPQHCGGVYNRTPHNWHVELILPPPKDERSEQDIRHQAEHDEAVKNQHGEINFLMEDLHAKGQEGIEWETELERLRDLSNAPSPH